MSLPPMLAANPRLDRWFIQDLNQNPVLPLAEASLDAAMICVGVQYLQQPVAVMADIARTLRPGAPLAVSFSNRCFPTKAVAVWRNSGPQSHTRLVDLYLRAAGFAAHCATGVSDNADLDRVSDLELFSQEFVGLTDGRPVSVGRMQGRSRLYHVTIPYAAPRDMVAIGCNDQCDVAVATVVADAARLGEAEHLALDFLGSEPVQRWAAAELGGNGI